MPLSQVAEKLHYNRQAIYKVKDRALAELDQILADEEATGEAPRILKLATLSECG